MYFYNLYYLHSLHTLALYFDKNSERLASMFSSHIQTGLNANTVQAHRSHYGINQLPPPPKPSILSMLWTQLTDFMILILLIVSIINFALKEVPAGVALLLVVIINVVIGVTQELKANKALEALMSLQVNKVILFYISK